MKNKILDAFYDVLCIFLLRMKMIIKDKPTLLVLFISTVLFSLMVHTLSSAVEDRSAISVGVVDNDRSSSSEELVARLKKVPALKIFELEKEELLELMQDEMIMSVFVIEEGYDGKLLSGDMKDSITMYYKEDNKAVTALADIVAGEMMYSICFNESFRSYEQIAFEGVKHSKTQYKQYMGQLLSDREDFNFAFQMIYVNPETTIIIEEPISNSLLYKQLIIGILGILTAFIAMFILSATVREKETGVKDRLKISRFNSLVQDCGNFTALLFTEGMVCFIYSVMIYHQQPTKDLLLWASSYLLLLLNVMVLGGVFMLIAKLVRSMIFYQLLCSVLILLTGGLGFYHLLTGLYQSMADGLLKFVPNNWFIQGFTDIIVYGNADGYIKEGHRILLIMASMVILTVIILDLLQELPFMKIRRMKETGR